MNKIFISSIIGILLLCAGCIYIPYHALIHRVPDEKMLASIKQGVTSKEDILMMLGEPDRVRQRETFFQYWWQVEHGTAAFLESSGGIRSMYSLHIYFDENNIVEKFEIKEKLFETHPGKFLLELYAGKYIEMGAPYISEIELKSNGKGVWRVQDNETPFRWSLGDDDIRLETESDVIYGQISDDILEILIAPGGLRGKNFMKAK